MFLTSNKTYNFYEMKKSDKKEFIEQLFDIGIFGDMYTAIHRDILDADKRILSIQNRLMVFKKNESDYDERLKKYDNDRAARILAIDSDIELAKNKLADARNAYKKVDVSARDKLDVAKDKLNNALKLLEKQYKEFNTEEIKFETAKNKLNQIIESRQAIISKHSDIMTKLCNDCKPIFANHYMLDKYQDEIIDANEKIEKIKIKISDIKTKITEISDKRQKIDEKISEIDIRIRKMISESAEAARIVATAEAKLLSVEKEKNKLESEKNPYIELLESNKKNMDNENTILLNEADSYKYLKSAENIVSHDTLRKFIISDLIGLLNNKIKTYLTRLGSRYTVEFDSDMNYEFITTGGKCEFNNFSAGERMRIMIATSFAFRDFMSIRNGLTSNVLVLDEYFDSAISSSGVRRVIDLLEDYIKEGQNVFIISHRSEVDQDIFDRIITVEKKNDISKITYNN
jgi:DNA repair exonuclease SbcCD ATPase subunit